MSHKNDDFLLHFGIFGMKWGVRRYQNEDGTLTEEGKKRYSNREKDIEYAKNYAKGEIKKDQASLSFWNREAQKSKDMPATKKGIKERIKISDDDYEDYLREYKTAEGIKKSIVQNDLNQAKIHESRIADWNNKIKDLEKVKIDAIMPDNQHQKQIDDIFTEAQGWLYREIDLNGLHSYMNDSRNKQKVIDDNTKRYISEDGRLNEAGREYYLNESGRLNDKGKEFFKGKYENSDGTLNTNGYNMIKSQMERIMKNNSDYEKYSKGDPERRDIKATYLLAKSMLNYIDKHKNATVSELQDAYDRFDSKYFNVYLPNVQERNNGFIPLLMLTNTL